MLLVIFSLGSVLGSAAQEIPPEVYTALVQLAALAASALGGGGAVWVVDQLKTWLKWSGHKALVLTAVVATAWALVVMFAEGQLSPDGVNWETLPALFGAVFIIAKARFDMLQQKKKEAQGGIK